MTGTFLIEFLMNFVSDCCFFSVTEFLRERTLFLKTPKGENEISGFGRSGSSLELDNYLTFSIKKRTLNDVVVRLWNSRQSCRYLVRRLQ